MADPQATPQATQEPPKEPTLVTTPIVTPEPTPQPAEAAPEPTPSTEQVPIGALIKERTAKQEARKELSALEVENAQLKQQLQNQGIIQPPVSAPAVPDVAPLADPPPATQFNQEMLLSQVALQANAVLDNRLGAIQAQQDEHQELSDYLALFAIFHHKNEMVRNRAIDAAMTAWQSNTGVNRQIAVKQVALDYEELAANMATPEPPEKEGGGESLPPAGTGATIAHSSTPAPEKPEEKDPAAIRKGARTDAKSWIKGLAGKKVQ